MKHFALLVYGLYSCALFAQQYNPDLQLDSLIQKLHQVIELQKDIEKQEIKGVYKLTPWHFVPSVSYLPIFDKPAHKSIFVTFSTTPLVTHMLSKRQEERRLSAIDRRYDNQVRSSEIKLKNFYLSLIQKLTNIQLSHQILLNDIEIFKIKTQEHANNEIDTESFLKEKSSILNKIKNHNTDVSDIQRYLLEIELLTEFEIELDILQFFVSPQVIASPLGEGRAASNDKGGLP